MREWKKAGTAVLAAAALLTGSLPSAVSAGNISETEVPARTQIGVQAQYRDSAAPETVYLVDVKWGEMQFTYTAAGVSVWNPATHAYEVKEESRWSGTGNTITVENHSNAEVTAVLSFEAAEGYSLTGTFDKAELRLPTAEGTDPDAPPTATTAFMLGGTLEAEADSFHTVGKITVAVK